MEFCVLNGDLHFNVVGVEAFRQPRHRLELSVLRVFDEEKKLPERSEPKNKFALITDCNFIFDTLCILD